jgi:radical SAM superfamily enzyme YgiQ (UPF0313 family)
MPTTVVLVNPPVSIYINKTAFAPLPVLVLGRSLNELKSNGLDISYDLIDLDFLLKQGLLSDVALFFKNAASLILDKQPDILLFTVHGLSHISVLKISEIIKHECPSCFIIVGGVGPTLKAKEALKRCPDIDIIVKGEGESVIKQLLKEQLNDQKYSQVPSIVYRASNKIIENDNLPTNNGHYIPKPDYSLIDIESYIKHNKTHPFIDPGFVLIESGRGCRHQCTFCAPAKMWSGKVRYRPIDEIISEMSYLADKGGNFSFFTQDNLEEHFLRRLSTTLIEENINISWGCYSRLDRLPNHLASLLSKAGCRLIFTGLETTNRSTQKCIHKIIDTSDAFIKLQHYNQNRIRFIGSFIAGFKDESKDDLNKTMRFAMECSAGLTFNELYKLISDTYERDLPRKNINICSIHPLCYMPGTDNFEQEREGLHISQYALHPDCYGSYLFSYEHFKDDWTFLGVNPYLNHLPEEKVRYYCSVLRIFNFLNSRPFHLAVMLFKTDMGPLEFVELMVNKIGDEFTLTAINTAFELELLEQIHPYLKHIPEWTVKKSL